jgi:hypothetical protein
MDLRVARKMNLGGRYRLELTGESFNLFNRDNQRYGVKDNGFYNSAGTLRKVLSIRWGSLLSRLLSATYRYHEVDKPIRSATDAIVDAAGLLRQDENFFIIYLT